MFHHADRDDRKSVGIAFEGGGRGGVDNRDGAGVLRDEGGCWVSEDMIDRGLRCGVSLADAMLGCWWWYGYVSGYWYRWSKLYVFSAYVVGDDSPMTEVVDN